MHYQVLKYLHIFLHSFQEYIDYLLPSICNLEIIRHIYKGSPIIPILSRINPIPLLTPIQLRSI